MYLKTRYHTTDQGLIETEAMLATFLESMLIRVTVMTTTLIRKINSRDLAVRLILIWRCKSVVSNPPEIANPPKTDQSKK